MTGQPPPQRVVYSRGSGVHHRRRYTAPGYTGCVSPSDWSEQLRSLRAALPARREDGLTVGSLRWLETELGRRGGNPAALRNIVYRDIGTPGDKQLLRDILRDLEREAGLEAQALPFPAPGPTPPEPPDEASHLSLGKRRLYRRFLAEVRRGKPARMLVVAAPGAGKTILVDALAAALPGSLRLRLESDFAPELTRLAALLNVDAERVAAPLSALDERAAFAVNGALQHDLSRALSAALADAPEHALLLRVGERATLGGHPLRLPDGQVTTPGGWVWHHLLAPLERRGPPLLVALSSSEGLPAHLGAYREVLPLPTPSLEDARKFVRAKLAHLPPPDVERIVRQAGRDYDALGLLTLLAAVHQGAVPDAPLPPLRDPQLRAFLQVMDVCFPPEFPEVDLPFFEALLGESLSRRRELERAFLEVAGQRARPTRPGLASRLLSGVAPLKALHTRALVLALEAGDHARAFHHALHGEHWEELLALPLTGTVLDQAWQVAQRGELPLGVREHLARQLAADYALRGQYHHPEMQAALDLLAQSPDGGTRAWAAVKRAEAHIDDAQYAEARAELALLPGTDPVTQAEHALSRAAVARWEGQAEEAKACLNEAETHAAQPAARNDAALQNKVRLWRALAAKDLGLWTEAIPLLEGVVQGSAASPLQRARAAYQLGDSLMRLGQQQRAHDSLTTALNSLKAHRAAPEELSHAAARLGSVLRRLGQLHDAERFLQEALDCAPDDFTRARALSEIVPLYAAQGRVAPALTAGRTAWAIFRDAEHSRPSEARYRRLRTEYRVALTYLTRGLQRPYLHPLGGATQDHPDLHHARTLLRRVDAEVPPHAADRLASLRVDTALALALATPDPQEATDHAVRAVQAAGHAYHRAQARIGLAEALLRAQNPTHALHEINRAYAAARQAARTTGDQNWNEPGLQAWLTALEFVATYPEDPHSAWDMAHQALQDPQLRPYRKVLAAQLTRDLLSAGCTEEAARLGADPLLTPTDGAWYRHSREGEGLGGS